MAQHFDVAVVGMQTAGIITAALLAKRGRRVLLVDHGENTTTYKHHGLALPLLPNLVPSLEHAPHVQKVHEELGLGPDLRAMSKAQDPLFQAILPKHRLDLHSDRDALFEELRLEFPDLVQPAEQFFARLFALDEELSAFLAQQPPLPPNSWLEKVKAQGMLRRAEKFDRPFEEDALLSGIPADHPVREMLLGPLTFFGHLWNDTPSTFHAVRLIARYYRGVTTMEEGTGGLAKLLLQAAERAGVTVRRGAVVRQIGVKRRRLTEITIEDDRMAHRAEYYVTNTVEPFQDLLAPEGRHPRYLMEQQATNPAGSLMVMNLVVRRAVIPLGMAHAAFLLNGRRRNRADEPADPPLFMQRFAAQRPDGARSKSSSGADEEHEILSVACPVRVADVEHTPARLNALRTQIISRVRRVVPFLDANLTDVSMPIDTQSWDTDDSAAGGRRVNPWRLHPIYEAAKRPLLGIAARSVRTYYKNLVHCGPDVVPGLGLEGEYIAGTRAATRLQQMAGRAWKT